MFPAGQIKIIRTKILSQVNKYQYDTIRLLLGNYKDSGRTLNEINDNNRRYEDQRIQISDEQILQ